MTAAARPSVLIKCEWTHGWHWHVPINTDQTSAHASAKHTLVSLRCPRTMELYTVLSIHNILVLFPEPVPLDFCLGELFM